jgi:hypothetical protein
VRERFLLQFCLSVRPFAGEAMPKVRYVWCPRDDAQVKCLVRAEARHPIAARRGSWSQMVLVQPAVEGLTTNVEVDVLR